MPDRLRRIAGATQPSSPAGRALKVLLVALPLVIFAAAFAIMSSASGGAVLALGEKLSGLEGVSEEEIRKILDRADPELVRRIREQYGDLYAQALDCTNLPPAERRPGQNCIEGLLAAMAGEQRSAIPREAYWLVPIYKQAARRYSLDWKLLAAINGARTRFGQINCDGPDGVGFMRLHRSAWERYAVNAGDTKLERGASGCYRSERPARVYKRFRKPWKPGEKEEFAFNRGADYYEAVDSIFTTARLLARRGAYGELKDGWKYSGSGSNQCTPPETDGRVYFPPDFSAGLLGIPLGKINVKDAKNIPKRMLRLYVAAGKRFGVDWRLLAAIGYNETRHNAIKATSPAGAQGAMQFMPGTFATYAVDGNGDGRKVITDPADSVFSAANYVRALSQLSWVGNNPILIMASYNAGPGNTQSYGGVPPFRETQAYVRNGMTTMAALGYKRGQPVVYGKKGKKFVVTGKSTAKEARRIAKKPYKGKPQTDPVSEAVAWDGVRRMSPCYVAVVWEWYKAIEKYPPQLGEQFSVRAPGGTRKIVGGGRLVKCPKQIPHDTSDGCYVDRRIVPDLLWIHKKFGIYITDGYSGPLPGGKSAGCGCHSLNGEHPLGLAVDINPAPNSSWDRIDKLARWAEPQQNRPRPPFRWVGYNGDANHGRGHHLHLSWDHSPAPAYKLADWVLVFGGKEGAKKKSRKRGEKRKAAKPAGKRKAAEAKRRAKGTKRAAKSKGKRKAQRKKRGRKAAGKRKARRR